MNLEDYTGYTEWLKMGLPESKIVATSKEHGEVPTWNTLVPKGKKNLMNVILSAHFDS